MLIVAALGGNAMTKPGESDDIPAQFKQTAETARILGQLIADGHQMMLTHGNGPQVGYILRRVEIAASSVYPLPLEICVADSQGGMGYMISQCLNNELQARGIARKVSSLITTVLVDRADPAFKNPTKPIGPFMTQEQAEKHRLDDGWDLKEIEPGRFRRVVASPAPMQVLEKDAIKTLLDSGHLIVACGGGGIPVCRDVAGAYQGVAAVVDKDRATALLAIEIRAHCVLLLTAVDGVYLDYGTSRQRAVGRLDAAEAQRYLDAGQFPAGSMGPKIEASIQFLSHTDDPHAFVMITDPEHLVQAMAGRAGTRIVKQ